MYNPWDNNQKKESTQKQRTTPLPRGTGDPRFVFAGASALLVILWIVSGFYQVDLGSVAVVTRFGVVLETREAGWHYRLPAPIDRVYMCNPSIVQQVEVHSTASHTITGDRNLVDVSYTVQWRISDPARWLFHVEDADQLIRLTAEAMMRDSINSIEIDEALAEGRSGIESSVKESLQSMLDSYDAGLLVHEVTLRRLDPPKEVVDAFYDVEKAWADHHHAVNQAEAFGNEAIPKARAAAAEMTEYAHAQSYQMRQVVDAESEAFNKIYQQCQRSGRYGGERFLMYNALQKFLAHKDITLIDGALPAGVLPLLEPKSSNKQQKESV